MVKAPSSHGLDRKYKSWRKGKSSKAKKQGSLKQHLRGQERLLGKLLQENQKPSKNKDDADADDRIEQVQKRVQALKDEIADKESKEHERQNAKKTHGTRFLERQRATRLERTARKDGNHSNSDELRRIALDMIYIAHFPHQKTYRPLYRNGNRWLVHSVSRAQVRQQIIQELQDGDKVQRVTWISQDMYARIPSEWSVAREVQEFQYPTPTATTKGENSKETQKATTQDDRFALKDKHDAVLEIANQLESKLDKQAEEVGSSSSSDSDSGDEDDQETVETGVAKRPKASNSKNDSSSNDSDTSDEEEQPKEGKATSNQQPKKDNAKRRRVDGSSDDSSSDSDSSVDEPMKATARSTRTLETKDSAKGQKLGDSDSSSDSSDSSDSDDGAQDVKARQTKMPISTVGKQLQDAGGNNTNDSDSEDDFFVAASDAKDGVDVFDRVKGNEAHTLAPENPAQGDKSQGWATQRQRPGQFKKKRVRRS